MSMPYKLPGLRPGSCKPEPVNDVVQPAFEYLQKVLAGDSFPLDSHIEVFPELSFKYSVKPFCFLLLTLLHTILGHLLPLLSVLSRSIPPSSTRAFIRIASFAFQEKFPAFPAAKSAN